ncbi:uncharacterized protein LOC132740701 [Ruditapes philippinarum]|uniref:uncharacterized protein LOC132740701 n=1 Tax=Ruditapes philippinarum TaxID=129788 RepID=UPI00295A5FE3|nr:uncharacterized protein LOC132740701 [Ruditapes philippinarum]
MPLTVTCLSHELKLQLIEQQIKDKENELGLMLNLRSAGKQNNLKEHFLLDLQIKVIAKNGEKNAEGNQRIYEVMRDYIKDNDGMTCSPFGERSTDTPVCHLVDFIKAIKKCRIIDISVTDQSSTDIQINCPSSKAMEDFLKSVISNEFQQKLFGLRRWLQVQYGIESHDIIANCSSNGMEKAKQHLHLTDVTRSMTCAEHQNTQCTLYCPDHDTFLCTACKGSRHGTCLGIKQVTSESSYVEQKLSLDIKSIKGTYNVKKNKTLKKKDTNDQHRCIISKICMFPNREILIYDSKNKGLKYLNSLYQVVSYCALSKHIYFLCYIGNNTAVVGLDINSIQYVDVSDNINLRKLVTLDHDCLCLACHGDTLYINSGYGIYKYDKYCKQRQDIYFYSIEPHMFSEHSVAISDNGERLYFNANTGLTTIDAKGNHIFTSSQFVEYKIRDICIAAAGIVLVLDKTNTLHQLDYTGKKHRTVYKIPFTHLYACSICFDRDRCRLIVGGLEDKIYIYKCQFLPNQEPTE